ncbi:MAG: hypothetical protein U1F36_15105 [Planctomycetota bacterium]
MSSPVVLSLAAVAALSFSPTEPAVVRTPAGDQLILEAGTYEIPSLVDKVAQTLGRNYLMAESEMNGSAKLVLQTRIALETDQIEPMLERLLYTKGFAIVPLDPTRGINEIISMMGPRRAEIMARAKWIDVDQVLAQSDRFDAVTTTVRLRNVNANFAVAQLRPFLSMPGGTTQIVVGSLSESTLLLTGLRCTLVPAVRALIAADDAAESQREKSKLDEIGTRLDRLEQAQKH